MGDWTLLKLLIEALRVWRPPTKRATKHESSIQRGAGSNLSTRTATNLMMPEERELTNLLSIREEGGGNSPIPSFKEKSPTPVELDHSDHDQLLDSHSQHSIEADKNSSDDDDVDSMKSNAGSQKSLLKYSEGMAKD